MTTVVTPRWKWRAFAPAFDQLNHLMPAEYVLEHDVYVISAASSASVKIRGGSIEVKTLEDVQHGLELWRPAFDAAFPICQRELREICGYLSVTRPPALFSAEYDAAAFITDVASCLDGVRVIGVTKTRRHTPVDGCIIDRAAVSVAGRTFQTAAVESADPAAVLRLIARLHLDRFENQSYVEFLKRLLGIRVLPHAHAPSEGARHEDHPLSLVRAAGSHPANSRIGTDTSAAR